MSPLHNARASDRESGCGPWVVRGCVRASGDGQLGPERGALAPQRPGAPGGALRRLRREGVHLPLQRRHPAPAVTRGRRSIGGGRGHRSALRRVNQQPTRLRTGAHGQGGRMKTTKRQHGRALPPRLSSLSSSWAALSCIRAPSSRASACRSRADAAAAPAPAAPPSSCARSASARARLSAASSSACRARRAASPPSACRASRSSRSRSQSRSSRLARSFSAAQRRRSESSRPSAAAARSCETERCSERAGAEPGKRRAVSRRRGRSGGGRNEENQGGISGRKKTRQSLGELLLERLEPLPEVRRVRGAVSAALSVSAPARGRRLLQLSF